MKRPLPTYFRRIWFLPSKNLLNAMYTNLHLEGVGGFALVPYWSSSEVNNEVAHGQVFLDGSLQQHTKNTTKSVRACRSFAAAPFAYTLGNLGPAGGLIFYIDGGTTYFEAAPSDQSTSKAWSNIINIEIGATAQGTAIGTGQGNTTAIIDQAGHTVSAALLCDNLCITN